MSVHALRFTLDLLYKMIRDFLSSPKQENLAAPSIASSSSSPVMTCEWPQPFLGSRQLKSIISLVGDLLTEVGKVQESLPSPKDTYPCLISEFYTTATSGILNLVKPTMHMYKSEYQIGKSLSSFKSSLLEILNLSIQCVRVSYPVNRVFELEFYHRGACVYATAT